MTDIQERRKSLSLNASPPIQQFATFKSNAPEPYTHIPTPLPTPAGEYTDTYPQTVTLPNARPGPAPTRDPRAKRDRSVDIYEKHTLTKPRVDEEPGKKFSYRTGAAAEFEAPPPVEKPTVKMQLPIGKRRSKSVQLMSAEDVIRANKKMNDVMTLKERSRERGEAKRLLMGNVKRPADVERDEKLDRMLGNLGGFTGIAERAAERSRSSSRNRWEQPKSKAVGNLLLAGRQRRRSLTIATGDIEESEDEEENPRTGRLGARF